MIVTAPIALLALLVFVVLGCLSPRKTPPGRLDIGLALKYEKADPVTRLLMMYAASKED